ncbi:phosphoribosylformylglycinamidine cyclo-ligase [Caldiplasma sukawensis]
MVSDNNKLINRAKIGEFVNSFLRQIRYRREDFKVLGIPGSFTSLIDMGNVAIAMNTDGVGTKTIIAEETGKWEGIGIDCVAMNVNDTITVGAEPIAMVDYINLKDPDPALAKSLGVSFNVGAQMSNISIIGGETALVPDLTNHVDVSGTVIGIVHKNQMITGENIKEGDLIFSLQSSGLHSNGFTTVRRIIKDNNISYEDKFPGDNKSVSSVLLEPTRIYVREILDIIGIVNIKGMANITGGGFKNIVRMKDMKYVIDKPVTPQNVFEKLRELGSLTYEEMYTTFNMGTGFVIVIDEESKSDLVATLRTRTKLQEIGHVENGSGIFIDKYDVTLKEYY